MAALPLEMLELESMASGNRSIRLTRSVTWEMFGSYAKHLLNALDGEVIATADSAPERVWTALIGGGRFWLAFDDFGLGVSLEPCDDQAAAKVVEIRARLLELRGEGAG